MSNTIKGENKLEGASKYRFWKKRIGLILENNKVLDLVKGKVKKPTEDFSDGDKVKYKELELVATTLMVEGIKDNLVPFIDNIVEEGDSKKVKPKESDIRDLHY